MLPAERSLLGRAVRSVCARGPAGVAALGLAALCWWLAWAGRHASLSYLYWFAAGGGTWLSVTMDERGNRRLLASLAAVWCVAEIIVRVAGPRAEPEDSFRHPDPYLVFRGKPGVTVQFFEPQPAGGSIQDATVELNDLGFRGTVPPMPKGRETRIIMLGSSAVFIGNPLSNSLAGHLERLFHERGRPEVRVYNWGVCSYVSGQELSLLLRDVVDRRPDLVIVYDGANDVVEPFVYEPRPGYPYKFFVVEEGLKRVSGHARLRGLAASILWKSRALRAAFQEALQAETVDLARLRAEAGYGTPEWEGRIVSAYLANVDKMATVARAWNVPLLVCLQPMALFKERRQPSERKNLGQPDFRDYVFRTYARLASGLADLGRSGRHPGARFVDLSGVFKTHEPAVFTDLVHITNEGNRLVAERLHHLARPLLPQKSG